MNKILALASLITLTGNFIPNFIAPNIINNKNNTNLKLKQNEETVINFDQLMKDAAAAAFKELWGYPVSDVSATQMNYSNFEITNIKANTNNDLETKTNPSAIFMGTNIFTNNTGQPLTMKTNSYEKTVTNQITSTITRGISLNLNAKLFIFNYEFNFEYNKTNTKMEEKTIHITSPSQTMQIPPHSNYKITVYSGQNISKISLNLNANISGNINCTINYNGTWNQSFSIDMATALLFLPSLPKGISLDLENNQINFNGVAIAENATANNSFSVQVEKLPLN